MSTPSLEQRFGPTSGMVIGWIGIASGLALAVWLLVAGRGVADVRAAIVLLVFVLLCWCFLARPRVVIGASDVELRNALSSWHVPLASVEDVQVRQATMVVTDERSYVGIGVGHPMRKLVRGDRAPASGPESVGGPSGGKAAPSAPGQTAEVPAFMTARVLEAAAHARSAGSGAAPVRRTWARVELAGFGVLVVALVVSLFF